MINWNMYAQTGDNIREGLGGLADIAGVSTKAKNRAALDQKFSSLASLGSPDTGAMTGLPLEPQRDRLPVGPAPEQFAGNPQPQQFDGPLGGFSNKDLIDIMRNPEAQDTERALVLDEYKRRTTPKDPYAEKMKQIELKKAELELGQFGKPDPLKPTASMQEYEYAQNNPEYAKWLMGRDQARSTNVNVGGPMKLTETQSKDLVFFDRGVNALTQLEAVQDALVNTQDAVAGSVPLVGNYLTSPQYQLAQQAGREFLASILRKDTGAAVTQPEMDIYGAMYLPQPGDSPQVLEQKAASRRAALQAINKGLGTAQPLANPMPAMPGTPPPPADAGTPPPGIDPADWQFMTPEERRLFQ